MPLISVDEDRERRDAERAAGLEEGAQATDDPAEAARLLAEADKLRERWDQPRHRFSSLDEIDAVLVRVCSELKADVSAIEGSRDADAIEALAAIVSDARSALGDAERALVDFANTLREQSEGGVA